MERKRTSDDVIKLLNKLYYKKNRLVGDVVAVRDNKQVKLPLSGLDVKANVVGRIADVTITQKYRNTFSENLEATYTFPLTASCSVYSVEMKLEDRLVKGEIKERAQARQDYQQAINAGKRACLMEQERSEVFTINVGNIQPDEEVTIEIRYCETLTYFEDGSTEIRVPLVVAPKYIPGESEAREQVGSGVTNDTDRVPDASRISPPRLVDGFDPETDLSINVSIACHESKLDHTTNLKNLACSQHASKTNLEDGFVSVSLANKKELLDRDFVLRWEIASDKISSAFIAHNSAKQKQQTGLVSIMPPQLEQVAGRDIVILLDRSGSMGGKKMVSAKRACKYLLSSLGPNDRFAINAFDHTFDWFAAPYMRDGNAHMHLASEDGINAGLQFLTGVEAQGGTEIGRAMSAAVEEFKSVANHKEQIIVLITDGHIGYESDVLKLIQEKNKDTRIFTIGIDSAVNYGFLEKIAQLSRGLSSFVNPGSDIEEHMRKIARTIGEPIIEDLEVIGVNCKVLQSTLTPIMMPDLFSGRTAEIFFKFESSGRKKPVVKVKGKYKDGSLFQTELKVSRRNVQNVSRLWAKRVISDLEDSYRNAYRDHAEIHQAIVDLSLEYSVLSRLTAFTAIDDQVIDTNSIGLRQAVQPVHNPAGWSQPSSTFAHRSRAPLSGGNSTGSFNVWGGNQTSSSAQSGSAGGAWFGAQSVDHGSEESSWGPPAQAQAPSQPEAAAPPSENLPQTPSSSLMGKLVRGRSDSDASNNSGACFDLPFEAPSLAKQSQPAESPEKNEPGSEVKYLNDEEIDKLFESMGANAGSKEPSVSEHKSKDLNSPAREKQFIDSLIGLDRSKNSSRPIMRIINAINEFFLSWSDSWSELENGFLPDVERLERSHKELIESMQDHPVGFELPKLTSFANQNYLSFINALKAPNHTIPALKAMKKQLNLSYDGVLNETQEVLTRALGKKGAFWQFTV